MNKTTRTKLIVGLGNPGKRYEHTFHNLGFIAVDRLCGRNKYRLKKIECRAVTGEVYIGDTRIVIAKPQTYMNLSGESVRELAGKYKVSLSDLLVVYDDIDIERATIRVRGTGSAGTHNGMRNIIFCLGDDRFPRLRIGAGRPPEEIPLADYVLMDIPKIWHEQYSACVDKAAEVAEMFMRDESFDALMRFGNSDE